jgi:hypothetical protein
MTHNIVCSHRMFAASYCIRHSRPLHTMSYAYIVCSRHDIVCDIAYDVAYDASFDSNCAGQIACALALGQHRANQCIIAMHNTRFRPGTPPQRLMPPLQRRPRRQREASGCSSQARLGSFDGCNIIFFFFAVQRVSPSATPASSSSSSDILKLLPILLESTAGTTTISPS